MGAGIGTIEAKVMRGKVVIIGNGQTPRGQNYIKANEPLTVESIGDPKFKVEMEAAVEKMLA